MTLLQLLNQEYTTPQNGWSFCFSHLAVRSQIEIEGDNLLALMLLLKQMAGVSPRKWRYTPLDTGYTKCLC